MRNTTPLPLFLTALVLLTGVVRSQTNDSAVAPAAPTAALSPAPAPRSTTLADEVLAKINAAGKIGYLQVMLSVIALGIALECTARLRRKSVCPEGLADEAGSALRQCRYDDALGACRAQPSVLADIIAAIIEHRDFGFSEIQGVAGDVSARRLKPHAQRAYPLAVIGSLSTLLGLLGTVIGMIGSFEAVSLAGSMGDPSIMASQISYALVTTAIGLSVAVPCIAVYHLLKRRAANLAGELDEQVSTLISEWQIALRRRPSDTAKGG